MRCATAIPLVLLAGCSYEGMQDVSASIELDGKPLSTGAAALVSAPSKCAAPPDVVRIRDGKFSLHRSVQYGRVAVIVQHDALCINDGSGWVTAWYAAY